MRAPRAQPVYVAAITTLEDIEALAVHVLGEHGLAERGWTFGWDRAVVRAGSCHWARRCVTLSWPIFSIEANRTEAHDVILHEVAHALAGPAAGHGPGWGRVAAAVGARPERCHQLQLPDRPVLGICACGPRHGRTRMPRARDRHRYQCRECRSTIDWVPAAAGRQGT